MTPGLPGSVELNAASASDILRDLLRRRLPSLNEPPYHSLQEVLYAIRVVAGFSVTDMAARLDVSPQAVSTVECGSTSFSASALERLAAQAAYYGMPRAAEYVERLAAAARHRSYEKGGKR